jgi:hypothetical protein
VIYAENEASAECDYRCREKLKTAIKNYQNHRYRLNYKGNVFAEPLKFAHEPLDSFKQNPATTDLYDRNT